MPRWHGHLRHPHKMRPQKGRTACRKGASVRSSQEMSTNARARLLLSIISLLQEAQRERERERARASVCVLQRGLAGRRMSPTLQGAANLMEIEVSASAAAGQGSSPSPAGQDSRSAPPSVKRTGSHFAATASDGVQRVAALTTSLTRTLNTKQARLALEEARREQFRSVHGERLSSEMQEQAARIATSTNALFRRRWVMHPEKTKILAYWDAITSLALLYTATLTPFETAFLPSVVGAASWSDVWFIINRVLDVIFLVDMCMQFFISFQTGNDYAGHVWVVDHHKIVLRYLRTWFFLDAMTVFLPGGFDIYLATLPAAEEASAGGVGGDEAASKMGMLRVLRALRLIKLVRLIRASRVIQRWKSRITLSYGTQLLLQCMLLLFFVAHWFACIIALQASLHPSVHDTIAGKYLYGLCTGEGVNVGQPMASEPVDAAFILAGCPQLNTASWYLAAVSWSIMVITGTGGTDFYPSSVSSAETLIVTVLVVNRTFPPRESNATGPQDTRRQCPECARKPHPYPVT